MFVKDIMTASCVVCTEDMPLVQVYQLMLENDCDFIPVIDSYAHKIPIGIITEHDICLKTIDEGRNPRELTAADVMNTNITKAKLTINLTDCADLMESKKDKRLFMVNENGGLCGTLTQFDIEKSKTDQQFEELLSRAIAKEYASSKINQIF